MTKFEEIDKLLEQNAGYLFSKDVGLSTKVCKFIPLTLSAA